MHSIRSITLLLILATCLSCGGTKRNLNPMIQEFNHYEREAGDLSPTTQGGEALEAARGKRGVAQPLIEKGKLEEAAPILMKALADVRVAWAVRQAYEADRQTDDCSEIMERSRYQWENALAALEEAKRAVGKTASDITAEIPRGESLNRSPLPRPVIAGTSPVEGDWMRLRAVWDEWKEAAEVRDIGIADLAARFDAQIAMSTHKETNDALRPLYLYLAGRSIQELEARVREVRADRRCIESIRSADRFREAAERAYQATLSLQKGYAEDLQAQAVSREDEMYAALRQLEGKYASIQQSARGTIVSLADILFDFDKATLKRDVEFNLVRIATILNQFGEMKITIEGHTDNIGTPEYNLDLSKRRAKAVFDFLVSMGVAETRMSSEGYGLTRPVADNSTEAGRQKNRRVDLVIKEEE